MKIPVIDLFAGPGGLGEGFSSILDRNGEKIFNIKLSIEKDTHAHQTLRLRSFFRQFKKGNVPDLYYDYIKENDLTKKKDILEEIKEVYSEEWQSAEKEAWHYELPFDLETKKRGTEEYTIGYSPEQIEEKHKEIDKKISECIPKDTDFLLIGGPPCQAYSLVGRARNKGISNSDHRVHLYNEYLRIIAKHHPSVFVMENVKGLLSAIVEGKKVFDLIKEDLKNPNSVFEDLNSPKYRVFSFVKKPDKFDTDGFPVYNKDKDYLIETEKYGIPQKRHRVILLGIREDIDYQNLSLLTKKDKITLRQVIEFLPKIRSGIGREIVGINEKGNNIYNKIYNTKSEWLKAFKKHFTKIKKEMSSNYKVKSNEFEDFQGCNFIETQQEEDHPLFVKWYHDSKLGGVLNHESRTHLKEDLARYLFSSLYLLEKGDFPKLRDYPDWLLPHHKNAKGGKFADRFRTQRPDQPATTVTSHISKDGHYFIHYDPTQCRSLTVREAARIQTFPDNYYLCGSRTHQYHQVGNAVPPFLSKQIAGIVLKIIKHKR